MKITHIKGKTFCIETSLSLIPFYKINEQDIILLDSGLAEERNEISGVIQQHGFHIRAILNSHAHIDHIGNNAYFKEKYNCLVAMPALEAHICTSSFHLKVYYSTLSQTNIQMNFSHLVHKTDVLIQEEDDTIFLLGIPFQIIHTPGHSPAHICIVTPDEVCYLGDTLMSEGVMQSSKMPYAFILNEDLKSKEKLIEFNYSHYILAHKAIVENIRQLIIDNIEFYKSRAILIYQLIESRMTFEAITQKVVKEFNINTKHISKYVVIERMLRSYVEYLTEINRLSIVINDGRIEYHKI